MILVPLVTQSAAEVVSKLMERVVGTFGALSDNGSAFTGNHTKRLGFEPPTARANLTCHSSVLQLRAADAKGA